MIMEQNNSTGHRTPAQNAPTADASIETPADAAREAAHRERLERDSERISDEDYQRIERDMPRKLANVGELKEGMEWLGEMIGRVTVLYDMVRDPGYKIQGKTKTLIAAGLLYFLLPFDMTPDFIPGLGYIDDALVLSGLWKVAQEEIERFLSYRERGVRAAAPAK